MIAEILCFCAGRRRGRLEACGQRPAGTAADSFNIACTFNRVFAHRSMSVSKSYVHRTLVEHAHAISLARRAIRDAKPHAVAANHCWGLDLTGRADEGGRVHTILGVLDHGSRLAIGLARVPRKCSWTLLGHLCLAIAKFGKPRCIRTDNARCFTSRVFTRALKLLGIRHQRIDLHRPWQNGRIERFFGSLKEVMKKLELANEAAVDAFLSDFAHWHNELRPHQALGGATPAEARRNVDPYHAPRQPEEIRFESAWHGLLAGFRIRR